MTAARPVLYDYWRSSASYRLRIALGLKAIAFERVPVDLLAGAQREAPHLARNPQGKVPALAIDGLMLSQSVAIIEYLDETRPEPPLLPPDPAGRARVRSLALSIAMEIAPICNSAVAQHVVEITGGGEPARRAWMQRFIAQGLDDTEVLLDHPATGRFCHGDAPGLADCVLVPQVYNAERWGLEPARWPRIAAITAACAGLPAFAAAHPDHVAPAAG